MEQVLAYFIIIIGFFFYVCSIIAHKRQKEATQQWLSEHNRKVMLGVKEQDWDIEIKEDCIHSEKFFLLENSGTYDTSYLKNCPHVSFISMDDMFLED